MNKKVFKTHKHRRKYTCKTINRNKRKYKRKTIHKNKCISGRKTGGSRGSTTITETIQPILHLKPILPIEQNNTQKYLTGNFNRLGEGISIKSIDEDPLHEFISNHTHSLDSVVLKNNRIMYIKNIRINNRNPTEDYSITRKNGNMLILSENESKLLCYYKINRNIFIDDILVYSNDINYDDTKSYSIECFEDNNDSELYGGGEYDILIYKYQDPVVRMVCEYVNILLDYFFIENNPINPIYTRLISYNELLKSKSISRFKYSNVLSHNTFWIFVREKLMGTTRTLHPTTAKKRSDGLEGSFCIFGEGKTNCCENTLHTFLNEKFDNFRTEKLFDVKIFNLLKQDENYKKYHDESINDKYKELYENPQLFLKDEIDNREDKIKFIEICQAVINIIIISSGRAEGKSVTTNESSEINASAYNLPYPPISVLEVFDTIDKDNIDTYVWIIRSERFHLSKSPCVHFGLQGSGITDRLTSFFCLEQSYVNNVILHSIGHCLDRLYCGHTHATQKYTQDNNIIFNQIFSCFEIFLEKMKSKKGVDPNYNDPNFKKINLDNFDKLILYLVSINDQFALQEYIKGKINLSDIYVDVNDKITDLFDINFSFIINGRGKYVVNENCWEIKKKYQCQRKLTRKLINDNAFTALVYDNDDNVVD
jgi:hypothetical protein